LAGSVDTNENNALFKIVDPANFPKRAYWPNRPMYLGLGWIMAIGIGFGMAFLKEFTDPTFADEDELSSQLKIPVLASIPIVIPSKAGKPNAANRPTLTLIPSATETNDAATFTLDTADNKLKHVIFNPTTIAGDQYRLIRTTLTMMQKRHGLKCLLVASAIPGEGKSFIAACLAGVLPPEKPEYRVPLHP